MHTRFFKNNTFKYLLLPALQNKPTNWETYDKNPPVNTDWATHFFVKINNNVALSTYEFYQNVPRDEKDQPVPNEHTRYVLIFGGNKSLAKHRLEMLESGHYHALTEDEHKQSNVIFRFYDYRGIEESTGKLTSTQQLMNDGLRQVENFHDRYHIPANKITLLGHSLGGAIATNVAAYLHEIDFPVKLVNARSFADFYDIPAAMVKALFDNKPLVAAGVSALGVGLAFQSISLALQLAYSNPISMIMAALASATLIQDCKAVVDSGALQMQAVEAFKKIPAADKMVYCVRDDKTIPFAASLFAHIMKTGTQEEKNNCFLVTNTRKDIAAHSAPDHFLLADDNRCILKHVQEFMNQSPRAELRLTK